MFVRLGWKGLLGTNTLAESSLWRKFVNYNCKKVLWHQLQVVDAAKLGVFANRDRFIKTRPTCKSWYQLGQTSCQYVTTGLHYKGAVIAHRPTSRRPTTYRPRRLVDRARNWQVVDDNWSTVKLVDSTRQQPKLIDWSLASSWWIKAFHHSPS